MSVHRKAFLEITNSCNLSCSFCKKNTRTAHRMTEAEFDILSDKLTGWAEYLYFHLMGEPTSHPLLPLFIEKAKRKGFRPMLTTNGTLLPRCGDALLSARPYKISISLHSFEANTHTGSFEDYLNGCLSFAEKAAESGSILALRLWNLDGRAEGALHSENDAILEMLASHFPTPWQENRSGKKLSDGIFLEYGEKFDWADLSMPETHTEGFCYALRDQLGVLCDGTVVPCCLDADGTITLGNLHRQTLDEILSSPRAKALYDGFSAHRCTEPLCRRCMRSLYYRS